MKKTIMVSLFALVTMVGYSQTKTTIGFMGGFGLASSLSGNYGAWVDVNEWGGSFTYGAQVSNESPNSYLYGNASKYTAGSSYYNIGIHKNSVFNNRDLFVGAGIQNITDITTNGNENNGVIPYVNVGLKKDLFYGVVRGEVIIGKIPSIGIGWGINF